MIMEGKKKIRKKDEEGEEEDVEEGEDENKMRNEKVRTEDKGKLGTRQHRKKIERINESRERKGTGEKDITSSWRRRDERNKKG
jgi:hypothetical protein